MVRELLKVENLKTYFFTEEGVVKAVDGVTFDIKRGEIFCLVGETGCGKSVTALSIMRLVRPPGKIVDGKIIFEGKDLLKLNEEEMREIRGKKIAMIFQNPLTSLNPVFTIGFQVGEPLEVHEKLSSNKIRKIVINLLRRVRIPDPEIRVNAYPHQLSGGMRQRSMIAMMISCKPSLLIADEPTTALDVTIQAQILKLIIELKDELGSAILLITHDFGVVAEVGDRVGVMYLGNLVELGNVEDLFREPMHPYTRGLLNALPLKLKRKSMLETIPGSLSSPINPPPGCKFHPRCKYAMPVCSKLPPPQVYVGNDRWVACHLYN